MWLRSAECGGVWRSTQPAGKVIQFRSLVACCLLVFCVSVGAGLVTMCVFHQKSSHPPPPHPTALDHRTSRSTPLISLSPFSLFLSSNLILFEFLVPHFIYNALSLHTCLTILSQIPPPHLMAPCLLLFSPPSPCFSWALSFYEWGLIGQALVQSESPCYEVNPAHTIREISPRISFVHFWHQ